MIVWSFLHNTQQHYIHILQYNTLYEYYKLHYPHTQHTYKHTHIYPINQNTTTQPMHPTTNHPQLHSLSHNHIKYYSETDATMTQPKVVEWSTTHTTGHYIPIHHVFTHRHGFKAIHRPLIAVTNSKKTRILCHHQRPFHGHNETFHTHTHIYECYMPTYAMT